MAPEPDETLDALSGYWRIFQLRGGHRWSTDDLLAAWTAVTLMDRMGRRPSTIVDLGCGIGSVGLLVAWHYPEARLIGVEAQPCSAELAKKSYRYNGVCGEVRLADLREVDDLQADLVLASPPYWAPSSGTLSTAPQKAECRFEERGGVEEYARAIARMLLPGGIAAMVFDGRQEDRVLSAVRAAGLELCYCRPVVSKEGRPPLLMIMGLAKTCDLSIREPALVLRDAAGRRTPKFAALREKMGLPPG